MNQLGLNIRIAILALFLTGCVSAPKIPDRDPLFDQTATDNVLPESAYPSQSRRLAEEGRVVIAVLVLEDGSRSRVELVKSSGFERLDKAAINWYEQHGKYLPGIKDGKAVAMWKTTAVNFKLKKPESAPPNQ